MPARPPRPRSPVAALALAAAVVAYAWWAARWPPFSAPAYVVTLLPGAGVLVAAMRRRPSPREPSPVTLRAASGWVAVATAFVSWELVQLTRQPRADHPTLSSIADVVLAPRPLRAAAFVAWLAAGWSLARR